MFSKWLHDKLKTHNQLIKLNTFQNGPSLFLTAGSYSSFSINAIFLLIGGSSHPFSFSSASVSDTRSEHFLPLVVCVPVVVLVLAAVLFLRCKKKTQRKVDGECSPTACLSFLYYEFKSRLVCLCFTGVTLDYRNTKVLFIFIYCFYCHCWPCALFFSWT